MVLAISGCDSDDISWHISDLYPEWEENIPYQYSNDHITATAGRSCSCAPIPTWAAGGHHVFSGHWWGLVQNRAQHVVALSQWRGQGCGASPSMLLCFCEAVGPFSGCCSHVFAQFPQSLLYRSAFISALSSSGHCLGQPIECSLFDHWRFNKLLSLPSAVPGYFFTLLLGTNFQTELLNSSCYFQVTEVTNFHTNVVYIHSPVKFEVSFRESIPNWKSS